MKTALKISVALGLISIRSARSIYRGLLLREQIKQQNKEQANHAALPLPKMIRHGGINTQSIEITQVLNRQKVF
ncbi:hypothetical protein [Flavobacterium sp.]|uniref:hypothetical protein n=1 Tax=Flavobacterium sp. TaxID=239 RepID=UPI0039E4D65F